MHLGQQMLPPDGSFGATDHVPGVAFVPGAARVAGGTGDALIEVNEEEHRRRAAIGLGAVTALGMLDRLLGLPLGEWVRWDDIHPDVARRFRTAPAGAVDLSSRGVRRMMAPAATVPVVLVRSSSWRCGLRTASAFEPFAQRVLLLGGPRRDLARVAWEADFLGVGVWLQTDSGVEEVLAPAPWRQRYVKAAGWRFKERAYRGWLNAIRPAV
ncbi:MAG: hypothetical protein GEV03_26485 [Streptosporangiales bacterium]|nr:hypothetical protein [Streptosporangiales bacterium]